MPGKAAPDSLFSFLNFQRPSFPGQYHGKFLEQMVLTSALKWPSSFDRFFMLATAKFSVGATYAIVLALRKQRLDGNFLLRSNEKPSFHGRDLPVF